MMQFGREPVPVRPGMTTGEGVPGWVCDARSDHFLTPSGASGSELTGAKSAQSTWDDDGGSDKAARA